MKTIQLFALVLLCAVIFSVQPGVVYASELKVMSTHAAMEVLEVLGPQFERKMGHKLTYSYDPTKALKRQIEQGASFDVSIATKAALDDLATNGIIGTRVAIGRSGLGVAVRKGAPKPDISTVEGFKKALLSAKKVVRSTEGASGLYFAKLMTQLGIADQMKDKIVLGPSGRIAEIVARGEADMAVQQISEILPVTGAEFVGPFPPEIQLYTVFSAGISTKTKQLDTAMSLLEFLKGPEAAVVIRSKGLEPFN